MSGRLYVVGIGPGNPDEMTPRARKAIESCGVLAGYTLYLDLLGPLTASKRVIKTAMKGEVERCRLAVEAAAGGETVAVVSSGDAGVYGMAGIVHELAAELAPDLAIEVIPGVTAACSAAAILGAPLGHDFCVVSLSDLLTRWDLIEKRLKCAAEGDFILCLYNPASIKRTDYLKKACDIVLPFRSPDTPCGIAREIGRADESGRILTLQELRETKADMFTTVIIGNSQTKIIGNRLITPRGYAL